MSVPESKLESPAVSATGLPRGAPGLGPVTRAGTTRQFSPGSVCSRLDRARALGPHAAGVRSLRLAGVGPPDAAGALDTNAAPSWKPLPYLFTVPYALFGHYEMWLWMITAVADLARAA